MNQAVTEELAGLATNDPDRLGDSRERFAAIERLSAAGEATVPTATRGTASTCDRGCSVRTAESCHQEHGRET